MNKGSPANSLCAVRKVRFFPAPPEILGMPSLRAGFWCARRRRSGSSIALRCRPTRWPSACAAGGCGRGQQLAAAAGGASAWCWRCRWWRTWPAARGGRRRCAGLVLALQVAVDVASSSRRPPAARWSGAGAAGGGGCGQQLAAAAGGVLVRCWRCRWWWTWPAARGGRRRCAGLVLALQVAVDVVSNTRRPSAARWPSAGAAGRRGCG